MVRQNILLKLFRNLLQTLTERHPSGNIYEAHIIEDIERNGYCFTDGVGLISLGLAKKVALSIGINITKDV